MFKRHPQQLDDIVAVLLRRQGLETPLKERRLVDAWEQVAGPIAARYTREKFLKNQTLFVHLVNPALKANLQMERSRLVARLNQEVDAQIITDIRFY